MQDKIISPKIWIPIFVVAAAVVLVFAINLQPEVSDWSGYPLPPRRDETANWQTYRNEEYGFEVKYPADWMQFFGTGKASSVDIMSYDLYDPKYELGNPTGAKIQIQYQKIQPGTGLTGYVPTANELTGRVVASTKVVVNNYEARRIENFLGADAYFLVNNTVGITILVFNQSKNLAGITDQILSTFKFVEPTANTSNWQTYRNEEYGFEFKYPAEWLAKELTLNIPSGAKPEGYVKSVSVNNNSDGFIGISIFNNQGNLSLDKWVEANMGIIITRRFGTVDVNGITGLKYITSEMSESLNVTVTGGNQVVNFYIDPNSKYQNHFDQILSTFRFID